VLVNIAEGLQSEGEPVKQIFSRVREEVESDAK